MLTCVGSFPDGEEYPLHVANFVPIYFETMVVSGSVVLPASYYNSPGALATATAYLLQSPGFREHARSAPLCRIVPLEAEDPPSHRLGQSSWSNRRLK